MKKFILTVFAAVMIVILMPVTGFALDEDGFYQEQLSASGADSLFDELPTDTSEMLEDMGITGIDFDSLYNVSPKEIYNMLKDIVLGKAENPLKFCVIIIAVIIIISMVNAINHESENSAITFMTSLIIVIALVMSMASYASHIVSAITLSSNFMVAFVPVYAAAVAASGNPTSAISYNTLALALAEITSQFAKSFLLPLIGIFIVLCIAAMVSPLLKIGGIASMLKKSVITLLSVSATVFSGLMTAKGILASSADTLALKGGKLVVSTLVPIIGGSIGDAYGSILGSISLLKNAIGIFGMIVISLINIPVIIETVLWMLSLSVSAFCAEAMGLKSVSELLHNINTANVILLAILLFNIVLIIISTGLVMLIRAST